MIRLWTIRLVIATSALLAVLLAAGSAMSYRDSEIVVIAVEGEHLDPQYVQLRPRYANGQVAGILEHGQLVAAQDAVIIEMRSGNLRVGRWQGGLFVDGFEPEDERYLGKRLVWVTLASWGALRIPAMPGSRGSVGGSLLGFVVGLEWGRSLMGTRGWDIVLPLPLLAALASLPMLVGIYHRIRRRRRGFEVERSVETPSIPAAASHEQLTATVAE